MGKRGSQRKNSALLDREDDEDDSFGSARSDRSGYLRSSGADMVELNRDDMLDHAVDALYEKRGSTREKALAAIIEGFKSHVQIEFVEKQSATLLHQCLSSVKRVSVREIALASHVIGLLALTVGCGANANEIFEESLPPISQALKSGIEVSKTAALLECLAIVRFVGGNDPKEKEKSMQLMWQLIRPKLGPNVVAVKPSPALISAVVTAWAFVLTSIDGNSCDPKQWQETVSHLSTLLDKDNRSVRIAAGEALAVIFEMGRLDKFSSADDGPCEFSHIQGLKRKVVDQIRDLSMEAGGKGTVKKDLNNQRNLFRNILAYVESADFDKDRGRNIEHIDVVPTDPAELSEAISRGRLREARAG
uniref:Interferon-related developmental regulator N-terminal domain-containing protein n=1 Tax=Kalanchoe fedtschenkoi TaxID=63787 RepID=A0A7N0TQT3_KALFE